MAASQWHKFYTSSVAAGLVRAPLRHAGLRPPGSLDFHHTITVTQLRATVDVHIHYSFEPENTGTLITRWLVLDITMPVIARPLRGLIVRNFDRETCGPWRRSRPTPRHSASGERQRP
jgi:hypothetical protein